MNNKAELASLQILKKCRENMVREFLEQHPDIYIPSYKYESSPAQFKLAKEKYFLIWLSSHWSAFTSVLDDFPAEEKQFIEPVFAKVFLNLLNQWSIVQSFDNSQLNLGIKLVEDMQIAINRFITVGDSADAMRNRLVVAIEKNRVVFDRAFKQLTGE